MATHGFSRPTLAIAIFAGVFGCARPAWAQVSGAARAAARQLATEGVNNFEAGEFTAASDKLNRAFEILRAPSLGLWSARALVKCAHLVQASERYLEVARLDPKTGDEAVQRQAQADAAREYEELEPRIPRVLLAVSNAEPEGELAIELDGVAIPAALLRAQVPVDPGEHVIQARQGSRFAKQLISLTESARVDVSLELESSVEPPSPHDDRAPRALRPAPRPHRPSSVRAAEPKLGPALWLTLSSAGAGIAVGSVTGILALQARASTAPHCPGGICDPKYRQDVDRLNTLRTASTVAFSVGGIGILTSGVLWLTAPRAQHLAGPYVRASVGLRQVNIEGAF